MLDKSYLKISARTADRVVSGAFVLFRLKRIRTKRNDSTFSLVTGKLMQQQDASTQDAETGWELTEKRRNRNTSNKKNDQRASRSEKRATRLNSWSPHCHTNVHVASWNVNYYTLFQFDNVNIRNLGLTDTLRAAHQLFWSLTWCKQAR